MEVSITLVEWAGDRNINSKKVNLLLKFPKAMLYYMSYVEDISSITISLYNNNLVYTLYQVIEPH